MWWLVGPEVDSSESLDYTEREEDCNRCNRIGLILETLKNREKDKRERERVGRWSGGSREGRRR